MAKDTTIGGSSVKGPMQSDKGFAFPAAATTPSSGAARLYKDSSNDLRYWNGTYAAKVVTGRDEAETVTATNVITAAESGKVFFLSSATEFVSTLPAPAAGLRFTFIVAAAPSGASYTIVTASSANIIIGKQVNAAGNAGDTGTTDDTISFVDGQAVVGDRVDLFCDGTNWFAYATCAVATGVTFTTAS